MWNTLNFKVRMGYTEFAFFFNDACINLENIYRAVTQVDKAQKCDILYAKMVIYLKNPLELEWKPHDTDSV